MAGRDDEWDGGGEDKDGDDDGRERIPEIPGLPERHGGGQDDGQRAAGVGGDMQEDAVHVVIVLVRVVAMIVGCRGVLGVVVV